MKLKQFARFLLASVGGLLGLVLLAPVVILWGGVWLVSWVVRSTVGRTEKLSVDATPWPELLRFDRNVGWRNRPNLDTHALAANGSVFRITTDEDGWRGATRLEDCDIVAVGDSFAYGQAASDSDFFGAQARGLSVKAIGANGYSMVHVTLLIEALAPRLAGKPVVWLVFYGNDLHDNLRAYQERYRQPFVREGSQGWELITHHLTPQPWPFHSARRDHRDLANLCSDTFLAHRAFSAAGFLLSRASTVLSSVDARLVVVGVPEKWQLTQKGVGRLRKRSSNPSTFDPKAVDRRLGAICSGMGIRFVALAEHLTIADYLPDDSHWNLGGHKKLGLLLRDFHADGGTTAAELALSVRDDVGRV